MFSDDMQIRKVQEKSLELMIEIDKYFKSHNIKYVISAGTALGAKRHSGFIPWDDDVDFDMHIDDMMKLAKTVKKDKSFQEKFFLQNKWTELNITEQFWRIRMHGTTMMDKEGLYLKMHWGLPIDIFPVFNAPNNKYLKKIMAFINGRSLRYTRIPFLHPEFPMYKKKIATAKFKIYWSLLYLMSRCSKHSGLLYYPTGHGTIENRFINKDIFFPTAKIEFEGHTFSCHNSIHDYLRITYGDYMTEPPKEMQINHGCYIIDMENDYTKYVNY